MGRFFGMMKNILGFISVFVLLMSCGEKAAYRIDGKLENLKDSTIYVVFEQDDITLVDTVSIDKPGQFSVEQDKDGFYSATLYFENKTVWVTVYLEKGEKIILTGDIDYPTLIQVKGGKTNNELSSVRKKMADSLKEQYDLSRQLKIKNEQDNTLQVSDLTSRLANVNHQISEIALDYIQNHPGEEASLVLMQSYFMDADDTRKLDELLAVIEPRLRGSYLYKDLEQFSERAKRTALGAEAPGFSVKNVFGETVSLTNSSDKYVLLTFTAPWCDMCQTENLYLDEIAQKYPKEQLDVLLISLDDDMNEVRNIIKKDSIQWNLVADSAGQAAMLIDLYNVSALPRSFLIDEEGKIILKTENGLEIKQTLEKVLEEK